MKILAVGGGSGGHVTPVAAVLHELRQKHPDSQLRFWCDNKFSVQAKNIMVSVDSDIKVEIIAAGKFRRYNHLSFWQQLTIPSVVFGNLRDLFFIGFGFVQSLVKLILWRPDVVFTKGGYVCLPVGIAAKILGIPLVIHDSDAHPGLTNRVLARFADKIATGAPLDNYKYPASKTHYVGIPIDADFYPVPADEQSRLKAELGYSQNLPLVVITGGGLGASRMNQLTVKSAQKLNRLVTTVLITGRDQYDETMKGAVDVVSETFVVKDFVSSGMAKLLQAADVVVTRAGATTLLELAALAKPVIIIPNARLTGGHQVKNAQIYERNDAAIVLDEDYLVENPTQYYETILKLASDRVEQSRLSKKFQQFAKPDAAKDVAGLIISQLSGAAK